MKKLFIILLLGVSVSTIAQKKYSAKDLFTENTIVWYGIDYSKSRFVGSFAQFQDAGTIDGSTLKNKYFPGWNNLVLNERKKYDLARFFKKESVYYDLTPVEKVNETTDADKLMQNNDYTLSESEISAMINKYKGGDKKEGIGVVFITESYNRAAESASYYVVVFDIASKKVLITDKFKEKPGGFGIKNYWASTILKVMEDASKNYDKWKSKG
jgi:hypothetical protein